MSDADLLRRAAAHARETAQAATPGPWWAHHQEDEAIVQPAVAMDREHGGVSIPDAAHIALWHPGVALAVADWLESTAAAVERHTRKVNLGLVRPDRSHEPALDVARALLGEGA